MRREDRQRFLAFFAAFFAGLDFAAGFFAVFLALFFAGFADFFAFPVGLFLTEAAGFLPADFGAGFAFACGLGFASRTNPR